MPNQQNKISFFEGALIIGLVVFFDIVQGVGQWVVSFVIAIGTPFFFESGLAKMAAMAISLATGGTVNLAIGLIVGAIFSFAMSVFIGLLIFWFFKRKQVSMVLLMGILGPVCVNEFIPFYNTMPYFTGATIGLVLGVNGLLRKFAGFALAAFTGGSSAVALTAEKKIAGSTARRALARAETPQQESEAPSGQERVGEQTRSLPLQIDGIRRSNDNTKDRTRSDASFGFPQSKVA